MKDIHATIIVDLKGKTKEDLFSAINKSKRKHVKKAKKEGLKFESDLNEEDIRKTYQIYSLIWEKGGAVPISYAEWKNKVKNPDYFFRIAKINDKVIGFSLMKKLDRSFYKKSNFGSEKGVRFYAIAGSPEFHDLQVNDFLYWETINFALDQGLDFVDLGGYQLKARGHLRGVNEFKSQWGGKKIHFYKDYSIFRAVGRKLIRNFSLFWWLNNKIKRRK